MPGQLTSFQRTMLHWNDLHPYNAIAMLQFPAVLDPERLRRLVNRALEFHGLVRLSVGRGRRTFNYQGGPVACEIKVLVGGPDPDAVLLAEIEAQLNTAFPLGDGFNPFRFFVLPQTDSFLLCATFLHAIADGEAVFHLLRDIQEAYLAAGEPSFSRPLEIYPRGADGLLAKPGLLAGKIAAWRLWIRQSRTAARVFCRNPSDFSNRAALLRLDAGQLAGLSKTAKAWHVTVNDLMLALLLMSFSRQPSDRMKHPRRRNISVGCIVNVRKILGLAGRRVFGPFLGSFMVTHPMPEGVGLRELAVAIQRQTLAIKRGRLYFGADLKMALGRFFFSLYSPARQKRLYHKNFPLWGGITNISVGAFQQPGAGEKLVSGIGAVSTGPLVPLVWCIVTAGDHANVVITYRPVFYPDENIARFKADFLSLVEQLRHEFSTTDGHSLQTAFRASIK